MIPRQSYINNLLIARAVSRVAGCVVECGVWKGGMIAGLAELLGPDREYFLVDSFEGLPPASEIDGSAALAWQSDKSSPNYHDNCRASMETAERAMTLSGARRFSLVKGWFQETLPAFKAPGGIALLRLDGDWYDSTKVCLEYLLPQMNPRGVVIVDDYYTWEGCARAVHEALVQDPLGRTIRQFDNDVCVVTPPRSV